MTRLLYAVPALLLALCFGCKGTLSMSSVGGVDTESNFTFSLTCVDEPHYDLHWIDVHADQRMGDFSCINLQIRKLDGVDSTDAILDSHDLRVYIAVLFPIPPMAALVSHQIIACFPKARRVGDSCQGEKME